MQNPDVDNLPEGSEHDRLYKAGVALVWPHLPLHGAPPGARAGFSLRRRLRKGVALLEERVIAMNPRNWAAMWLAGMACRRAGDGHKALALFDRACTICDSHPDLPREAGLTAMNLGRYDDAIRYTQRAIEIDPDDPGLVANLALAHLFNQQPADAKQAADYALKADPADPITRRIVHLIDDVLAGKRRCPRGHSEL